MFAKGPKFPNFKKTQSFMACRNFKILVRAQPRHHDFLNCRTFNFCESPKIPEFLNFINVQFFDSLK